MSLCVESEFSAIDKEQGWGRFFEGIRSECTQNHSYSFAEAKKNENKNLNRYRDVNPYDHSRVVLSKGATDYINASLVVVEKAKRKYILTQGPLPHTTPHFWLMIWEQGCKGIVMLNKVYERCMVKCHQYWPTPECEGRCLVFNDVGIKVTNVSDIRTAHYTTSKLKVEDLSSGMSREVLHFHYTTWPDFEVPQSPTVFLRFLAVVRASGALSEDVGPAVVHCSAGIGRSGTFCLVDSCLVMINEMKMDNIVVKDILMDMRQYRMGLIQTPNQLKFSYLAVIEGVKNGTQLNGTTGEEEEERVRNEEVGEEEEEPPPLPPPRGESLARSRPDAPSDTNSNSSDGARQRKKDREEMNQKIREMKQKMFEAERRREKGREREESWKKWKKSLLHPWAVGCFLLGGGIVVYTFLLRG